MSRPLPQPYPETDLILTRAYLAFDRNAPADPSRGWVTAHRNDEVGEDRTLSVHGYATLDAAVAWAGVLAPAGGSLSSTGTEVGGRRVGAQLQAGPVSDEDVQGNPTNGVNAASHGASEAVNYDANTDNAWVECAFEVGKQGVYKVRLECFDHELLGWAHLEEVSFDATQAMYKGSLRWFVSLSRAWAACNGAYNVRLTTEKSDGTDLEEHDLWTMTRPQI